MTSLMTSSISSLCVLAEGTIVSIAASRSVESASKARHAAHTVEAVLVDVIAKRHNHRSHLL